MRRFARTWVLVIIGSRSFFYRGLNQRTARGASRKGPRQTSSKSVKDMFEGTFRHVSRRAKKSKIVKNLDGPIRANRSRVPELNPISCESRPGGGAKNCKSRVWGDSRESLACYENRGLSANRFARIVRIAPIRNAIYGQKYVKNMIRHV